MISICNLRKCYDKFILFDNLNISFPSKGLYLIRGDNGSGKTSLLYILGLLDFDYEGKYELDDELCDEKDLEKIRNKYFSYVMSKGNLIPFLSVGENLSLNVKGEVKNFAPWVDTKQSIYTLSGGEEILIALSHEVSLRKKIYLLDEVTSALDDENVDLVMKIVTKLAKDSLIIMTAHDSRILKYFDNIIEL